MNTFIQKTLLAITMTTFVVSLPIMAIAAPAVPTGLLDAPCAPNTTYNGGDCSAYPLGIGQSVQDATPGSIPFIDNNGELQQNNANLMWDEINNRLTLSQGLVIGSVNTINRVDVGSYPTEVNISGDYAYVANQNDSNISIIDISTPASASVVNTVPVGNYPERVVISGNYAYVTNSGSDSISIIDISTPASASVVQTVNIPSGVYLPVTISGNYAYNVSGANIDVIDISTPASASVVHTINYGGNPPKKQVTVSGNYAYVSVDNTVSIIDISTPTSASVVSTVNVGNDPERTTVSGNYAYVSNTDDGNISIIDISTPASASVINTVNVGNGPLEVIISGNYAYVVNDQSENMSIIDISTPASASVVNTVGLGESPYHPVISGNYAYVSSNKSDAVSIIDISTPASASVIGTVYVNSPRRPFISGNYAYVSTDDTTVDIINLSEISSIYAPNDVVALSVDGTIASSLLSGSGVINLTSDNNGNIIPSFSDESLKENVVDIANPLTLINNLKGHYFNWKDADRFGGNREMGFIAQEVAKVVPEVVRDVGGLLSVNYQYLTALNVEGIKAMDIRISDLEALMGLENDSAKNTLFSRMREYLGSVTDKVIAGVVRITGRIMQPELCLYDDAGMTCIDRSGLKGLLDQSNINASYDGNGLEGETVVEEDEDQIEEVQEGEITEEEVEVIEEEEEVVEEPEVIEEEIIEETEAQEEEITEEQPTEEQQEIVDDQPATNEDDEPAVAEGDDSDNPAKDEHSDVEDVQESEDITS